MFSIINFNMLNDLLRRFFEVYNKFNIILRLIHITAFPV